MTIDLFQKKLISGTPLKKETIQQMLSEGQPLPSKPVFEINLLRRVETVDNFRPNKDWMNQIEPNATFYVTTN